jgi:hypothetical protein
VVRKLLDLGLATCAIVVIVFAGRAVLTPSNGEPGWMGAAIHVPECPADVDGCRVVIASSSGSGSALASPVYKDWSGSAVTLDVPLPQGTYEISAEGCTGDQIGAKLVTVTSGFHDNLDLGADWQIPHFVGRSCPGFGPAAPHA